MDIYWTYTHLHEHIPDLRTVASRYSRLAHTCMDILHLHTLGETCGEIYYSCMDIYQSYTHLGGHILHLHRLVWRYIKVAWRCTTLIDTCADIYYVCTDLQGDIVRLRTLA